MHASGSTFNAVYQACEVAGVDGNQKVPTTATTTDYIRRQITFTCYSLWHEKSSRVLSLSVFLWQQRSMLVGPKAILAAL